jgi:phosphate transport system permease protein
VSQRPVPTSDGDRQPFPAPSSEGGPSVRQRLRDRQLWIRSAQLAPALVPLALTIAIVGVLVEASHLENFGWWFFTFNFDHFGILIFVVGSFLTAVPALAVAMLAGLGIAIASTTYLPKLLSSVFDPFVDLLAGIPSVVYGIWGYWVLGPYLNAHLYPWTILHLSRIPGFGRPTYSSGVGDGLLLAIIILTLMILPITTLLMRDALRSVPRDLWESGLALGATRWEVTRKVALPYARRGVWGAAFLGFGRAIGETVAVAMVIDQASRLPSTVYSGTSTMASLIITTIDSAFYLSASGVTYLHFLTELALVLLAITLAVNLTGRWIVRRTFTEVPGL